MKCNMCGNEIPYGPGTTPYKLYLPPTNTDKERGFTVEVNTCGRCFIAVKTLEALQAMLNKLGELI